MSSFIVTHPIITNSILSETFMSYSVSAPAHTISQDKPGFRASYWYLKLISHKWRPKESRSSSTHIRQNRLWNKGCEKRQRRTLHNDQYIVINPERLNNYEYIHAPNTGASIHKANGNNYKRWHQQQHSNSGRLTASWCHGRIIQTEIKPWWS